MVEIYMDACKIWEECNWRRAAPPKHAKVVEPRHISGIKWDELWHESPRRVKTLRRRVDRLSYNQAKPLQVNSSPLPGHIVARNFAIIYLSKKDLFHYESCDYHEVLLWVVKPRFLMSGTLIFSHNSQNMTYFVSKFGMRKFCVVL